MKIIPIPLSFGLTDTIYETKMGFKTADINSAVLQFTSDTDPVGCVATLSMKNETDNSHRHGIVLEQMDVTSNPFSYTLGNEIGSSGVWIGEITLKKDLVTVCSQKFRFSIGESLQTSIMEVLIQAKSVDEMMVAIQEDVTEHLGKSDASVNQITTYVNGVVSKLLATDNTRTLQERDRVLAELARETDYQSWVEAVQTLIDTAVIDNRVQAIIDEYQSTYAQSLFSVTQQLTDTLNKSAITLSHMFADNTVRDTYFIANPTELTEQLFIKVGTGYQQRLSGAWQASTAIVAEQLSATSQPIVDTGNYFATDNTNAALQELGAHKASSANPHGVTKAQVGLGNTDNTSDANKPISTAGQTALNLKANKVQEAWITPTLLNGWVNFDDGVSYTTCAYMKSTIGFVTLKGMLKSGSVGMGTPAFTLPVGYRPSKRLKYPVVCNGAFGEVDINVNGDVGIIFGNNAYVNLDSITFRVEQ